MSARPEEPSGAVFSVDEPGSGFMYCALVRALRPRHVVLVGSLLDPCAARFALGLKDNDHGKRAAQAIPEPPPYTRQG